MRMDYICITALFPFEMVPQEATFVIYGMGYLGQIYMRQVKGTNYARLKYVVDRNWKKMANLPIQVFPPNVLKEEKEAMIVVAVGEDNEYHNIKENLLSMGISEERIIHSLHYYSVSVPSDEFITHTHYENGEKLNFKTWEDANFFKFSKSVKQALKIQDVCNKNLVRIGEKSDGGYIMLNDFTSGSCAYSFGINNDVSWDNEMAERGYNIYMYDHTIDHLPYERNEFHFFKQGISANTEDAPRLITLEQMLKINGHMNLTDMVMKMDVEGYEWEIFRDVKEEILLKFKQIVVEFHYIFNTEKMDEILFVLRKLNNTHQVVHVHANNYANVFWYNENPYLDTLEVTYVRRQEYEFKDNYNLTLPISIDMPNCPYFQEIPLGLWNQT